MVKAMRLCSKSDCPRREGKGYKCIISTTQCPGEYTEVMLREAKVNERDIQDMKDCGLI